MFFASFPSSSTTFSILPSTEDFSATCFRQLGCHLRRWRRTEIPWRSFRCTWRSRSTCPEPRECNGPRSLRQLRCRRDRPWRGRRRWSKAFRLRRRTCRWRTSTAHRSHLSRCPDRKLRRSTGRRCGCFSSVRPRSWTENRECERRWVWHAEIIRNN